MKKTFYCSHCGITNHVEFELGEPPRMPEPSLSFPDKVKHPTEPTEVPMQSMGWNRETNSCHLQKGVWQILKYGFDQAWIPYARDKIRLMNGSESDGSAPSNNPEHTNGECLDFRYPLNVAKLFPAIPKDIDWEHMLDLVELWVDIRNEFYPKATIKILMYQEFLDYMAAQYRTWYDVYCDAVRFVGTTGEGGRAHKDHCHVQIKGAR